MTSARTTIVRGPHLNLHPKGEEAFCRDLTTREQLSITRFVILSEAEGPRLLA